MCGIVGYLGKNKAVPVLLAGLHALEYRGYDSAGLAVFDKENVICEKAVGTVTALEDKLVGKKEIGDGLGIAHTRWATHGGVTEINAHPHTDCSNNIYLAHNGIIENYKELREKLNEGRHQFKSETDTEVIAHLIEKIKNENENIPLEEAVRLALGRVQGTYGLVVIDKREPEKIVAARNFSPLIFGLGQDEFIIASDATPIMKFTNKVIYLNDGEIATITPAGYRIQTIEKEVIKRKPEELDWDLESAEKGTFANFMLKEINEEPEAVRNSIRGRINLEEGKAVLGGLADVKEELRNINRLHICACGSAYLAGKVGAYMLEEYAGVPVEIEFGSEMRYRKLIFEKNDVFLAISQSGETADTLASLYEAKEKEILTLGIVNAIGSTASRETDAGVYQHIGPEVAVAATKSFVSQVSILALLTLFLGRKKNMSLVMGQRIAGELQRLPALMDKILTQQDLIKELAEKYSGYDNFLYLGRKYNYPIALEGALKIKEIAYVHAEGYASGEMKHGPIALVDKKFPSIVIVPRDSVYEKNVSNMEELKARGGPVMAVATEGDKDIKQIADDVIYIPKTLEMLTPILSVVPLHLFAYYVAVKRGLNVDRPRNLAKSVTVE
ncbi:MAG: glutamine--fructose-6-phosphate transaminase (isomerizing) [Candidatus Colwellbacteria bacterium]|nr:glutamine--fructose-6-phosphate transaminase (isomerizing) [Candidatus Colwellbacteria bacterium]